MGIEHFAECGTACELLGQLLLGELRWGTAAMSRLNQAFLHDDGGRPKLEDCAIFIPGLDSKPWYSAEEIGIAKSLEDAWPHLCSELLYAVRTAQFAPYHQDNDDFIDPERWWTADLVVLGREHANSRLVTDTLAFIKSREEPAEMMTLSLLAAGGRIRRHCGPWNTRITVHFAIEAPTGCRMRVGREWRAWEAGKCLVFDDSFEHECANESTANRTVLLFDLWHPGLTDQEVAVLKDMLAILQREFWSKRDNKRTEEMDAFTSFVVVANDEQQYALWPAELQVPSGWRAVTEPASKEVCLDWVHKNWTDMRPLSLREGAGIPTAACGNG